MPRHRFWRADPRIRAQAKRLRRTPTRAEAMLWERLRRNQVLGLKFRRQHPLGDFIVDFYCARAKLVIEIDGGVHEQQRDRDEERTAILEQQGYRVIRFANTEVEQDIESVLQRIAASCQERTEGQSASARSLPASEETDLRPRSSAHDLRSQSIRLHPPPAHRAHRNSLTCYSSTC